VLGGGAPQAAGSITVYWDAVSACGATLGNIYDGTAPSQVGGATLVEQQDAWLVKLDAAPVASDAFWAAWDATGGVFTGGYSVHLRNALGMIHTHDEAPAVMSTHVRRVVIDGHYNLVRPFVQRKIEAAVF
jgi:hypothetical protein